jgi:lipopolysaccharide export system protein LptA
MACKFHADPWLSSTRRAVPSLMPSSMPLACRPLWRAAFVVGVLLCALPVAAERADRSKPMVVEANKPGTLDLQRQVVTFAGDVVIQQGTMVIRAERVEIRETPDGFRSATATGLPGKPASYRQKRDGVDEILEGAADRIELDGRTQTLRLVGNGAVRRLSGNRVLDEITGALITWDNNAELFSVQGAPGAAAGSEGRVRAILSPREERP